MSKKLVGGVIIIVLVIVGIVYLVPSQTDTLTLSFTNLEPLEQGHYEGWAIFGEEKVSTGKFDINDPLTFTVDRDLDEADQIVITIEPEGDVDNIPSEVVLLAGDILNNAADLSFPVDFSGISGGYILATPTNDPDLDETSGLWFLQLPPPPTAGLVLPDLGSGWKYEGWAVNQGKPITTGKFSSPEGIDEFDGYSGSADAPPFPGEDFLVNAPTGIVFPIDLADGESKAVISIEPDINGIDPTGDAPFQIKPFVADVPFGAGDHVNYQMNLNLESIPSGSASLN